MIEAGHREAEEETHGLLCVSVLMFVSVCITCIFSSSPSSPGSGLLAECMCANIDVRVFVYVFSGVCLYVIFHRTASQCPLGSVF